MIPQTTVLGIKLEFLEIKLDQYLDVRRESFNNQRFIQNVSHAKEIIVIFLTW